MQSDLWLNRFGDFASILSFIVQVFGGLAYMLLWLRSSGLMKRLLSAFIVLLFVLSFLADLAVREDWLPRPTATSQHLLDDGAKWRVASDFWAYQSKEKLPCRLFIYHNSGSYSEANAADLVSIFSPACAVVTNQLATFDLANGITVCALPTDPASVAMAGTVASA
jgi:hypothetical protein